MRDPLAQDCILSRIPLYNPEDPSSSSLLIMAKAMRAAKAMKAMKRVSKFAKGKLAKLVVFRGNKEATVGGLTKSSLTKNKNGKIVSKKASAAERRMRWARASGGEATDADVWVRVPRLFDEQRTTSAPIGQDDMCGGEAATGAAVCTATERGSGAAPPPVAVRGGAWCV